jgi:hypothetical protein
MFPQKFNYRSHPRGNASFNTNLPIVESTCVTVTTATTLLGRTTMAENLQSTYPPNRIGRPIVQVREVLLDLYRYLLLIDPFIRPEVLLGAYPKTVRRQPYLRCY